MAARLGLLAIVLAALSLSAVALTRPAGEPPASSALTESAAEREERVSRDSSRERVRISKIEDLASMSEEDLRRLADGEANIDLEGLGADAGRRLEEMSKKVRTLDQRYEVPAVRGATSWTGASGRRRSTERTFTETAKPLANQ